MTLHTDSILYIDDLPAECIEDCTRPGMAADAAVQHWRETLDFTVNRKRAVECLCSYGAWERAELEASSDEDLAERILWLACGNFDEWDGTDDSPCGSDIFVLE